MNDGAVIKNVSYEDVTLTNTSFPIFMSVTALLRGPTKTPGHAENIRFRNITASNIVAGNNPSAQNSSIVISGAPGIPHQGIVLDGVTFVYPGSDETVLREVSLRLPAGSTGRAQDPPGHKRPPQQQEGNTAHVEHHDHLRRQHRR